MLTEVIYDLDEFLSLLAKPARIHHEYYWKVLDKSLGFPCKVEAGLKLYGISKEGHVLICVLSETMRWDSDELNKHDGNSVTDRFNAWISELWEKLEKKAKGIGSTPGRFEGVLLSGRN